MHEVLVAWQAGRIGYRRAIDLAGVDSLPELYAAARSSGVPLRKTLLPEEKRAADYATAAIIRRLAESPDASD